MMKTLILFLTLQPFFLLAQEKEEPYFLSASPEIKEDSYFTMPKKKKKELNDFKLIEQTFKTSPFIQGYKYNFDFKGIEDMIPIETRSYFLKYRNVSIFNRNLIKDIDTNLKFNGSATINGITQVISLKGKLNKYDGIFFFQISYHIRTNSTSYIPKIVNEKYQEGLALKVKLNLERGK